jgi:DUF4097 and DUF4098 domain-containing protein YvlB
MKPNPGRLLLLTTLSCALVIFLAINAFAGHKDYLDRKFDVKPGGLLTLDSDRGSVLIETNTNNKVMIEVVLKADTRDKDRAQEIFDNFEIEFDQDGKNVIIVAEYKKSRSFWGGKKDRFNVEFSISVPEKYNLDIITAGGSIMVDDLEGDIDASTSGGSLNFRKTKGSIHGRTSGGSISLKKCEGLADVRTSGGSINIGHVKGDVDARTSGGSINVEEVIGVINASTSGGSVTAHITGQPKDDCRLTTSGGSVNIYMDENVGITVDAKTSAGYVDTDFPVTMKGKLKKSVLRGDINGGGPELYLRTSGGNIYLNSI